jgi:hypothetical protein
MSSEHYELEYCDLRERWSKIRWKGLTLDSARKVRAEYRKILPKTWFRIIRVRTVRTREDVEYFR